MAKISTDKKKSLHGVVLIMVVTVMFVLIIMLLATLSVVSTAQNRAYAKFEENQAYYSARSALDVYVNNMLTDQTYYASDSTGGQLTHNGIPAGTKFSQGLAMELDLYRIKAHSDTYENYLALSDADKENFSTDHWANPNGVFTAEPAKSDYDKPTENYVEYEVTYPKIDNTVGNQHGKFNDSNAKATIKVEVLARTFGGHSDTASNGDANDINSIASASRAKDTMTIKVTSTAYFEGYEGTAVGIYTTVENPAYFQDALSCFGTLPGTNNTSVIGGVSAQNALAFKNDGVIYGGLYSKTQTVSNEHEYVYVNAGESIYINNYSATNASEMVPFGYDGSTYDKVPIIYIDCTTTPLQFGAVDYTFGGSNLTDPTGEVLVIVNGNVETSNANTLTVHGDMIINGDLNANGMLFNVTGSLIVTGDFNVKNNRVASGNIIGDRIYVGGNYDTLDLNGTPTDMDSKVYGTASGKHKYMAGTDMIDADFANNFTGITVAELKTAVDLNGASDTNLGKEITLISASGGAITKGISRYIVSEGSRFSSYLHSNGSVITAEEWAGTPNEKDRKAENYTALNFSDLTDTSVINGDISVAGKQKFYWDGTYSTSKLTITGSGTANIYVKAGATLPREIVVGTSVTDKPKVNFYFPSGTYSIDNTKIWSYEIKRTMETSGDLRFGADPSATAAPTTKMYFSSGATLNCSNNCLIAAYIYAPQATINFSMGVQSNGNIYYNNISCDKGGSNIKSRYKPVVIGAVVCNNISAQNDNLYCYIEESADKDTGIPQLEWSASEFRAR